MPITFKKYACKRCGHEKLIDTNHYGKCWSLNRYNTCPKCPPWAKYPEYGGQTIWECLTEEPTIGNLNERGNWMIESFVPWDTGYYHREFYGGDWYQYRTDQDADYFGIWVNDKEMKMLTYAEGDVTLVCCMNQHQYLKEWHSMNAFYKEG